MTRRHYEDAARIVQETVEANDCVDAELLANTFAVFFAQDSAAFDRDRFLRACVPGANVRARG